MAEEEENEESPMMSGTWAPDWLGTCAFALQGVKVMHVRLQTCLACACVVPTGSLALCKSSRDPQRERGIWERTKIPFLKAPNALQQEDMFPSPA